MSSSEAYKIASDIQKSVNGIEPIIDVLNSSIKAVNKNQVGEIPDAITENINSQIKNLEDALTELQSAHSKASVYARKLAEEERRKNIVKNIKQMDKKDIKNIANKNRTDILN